MSAENTLKINTVEKTKFKKLIEILLANSHAKEWDVARKEWKVKGIYFVDFDSTIGESAYETCTCSHYPIKEVITIVNTITDNEFKVGNCCITKIIGEEKENKRHKAIFNSLKNKKLNKELIEQAYHADKFINEWEYNFMYNIFRKRSCSPKQFNLYTKLTNTILNGYKAKFQRNKV